jgi:hypothetical protein
MTRPASGRVESALAAYAVVPAKQRNDSFLSVDDKAQRVLYSLEIDAGYLIQVIAVDLVEKHLIL